MIILFNKLDNVWSEEFEVKMKGKIISFNWTLYYNWGLLEQLLDNTEHEEFERKSDQSGEEEENPFYQTKTSFKID